MRIKFLADENLRRAIVLGVRRRDPGVSFVEAFEVGAVGKSDPAVLGIAAREGRIVVSHDVRTMP
jgi:predicted nuclease of predicted toxin-antitoxin system